MPAFAGMTLIRTSLPAGDFWKQEHLAIAGDLLQQCVLIDLAVDGDGEVRFQMRTQVRMALTQRLK